MNHRIRVRDEGRAPKGRCSAWDLLFGLSLVGLLVAAVPEAAHATNVGRGAMPYEGPLILIRESITGPVAFSLSMIGIVLAGSALLFGGDIGGFFKQMVVLTLVISVVVGSANMLNNVFSQGAEIGPPSWTGTNSTRPQPPASRLAGPRE